MLLLIQSVLFPHSLSPSCFFLLVSRVRRPTLTKPVKRWKLWNKLSVAAVPTLEVNDKFCIFVRNKTATVSLHVSTFLPGLRSHINKWRCRVMTSKKKERKKANSGLWNNITPHIYQQFSRMLCTCGQMRTLWHEADKILVLLEDIEAAKNLQLLWQHRHFTSFIATQCS